MTKRVVGLILAMVLLLTGVTAFAATPREMRLLEKQVEIANARVDVNVCVAKRTPWDDVEWLLWSVDRIVTPVFRYAALIGATVVCEYETHYIDGQYVEIDPLRVVH